LTYLPNTYVIFHFSSLIINYLKTFKFNQILDFKKSFFGWQYLFTNRYTVNNGVDKVASL
jgi:hypothetical protein